MEHEKLYRYRLRPGKRMFKQIGDEQKEFVGGDIVELTANQVHSWRDMILKVDEDVPALIPNEDDDLGGDDDLGDDDDEGDEGDDESDEGDGSSEEVEPGSQDESPIARRRREKAEKRAAKKAARAAKK
jgi:hypothetical protein